MTASEWGDTLIRPLSALPLVNSELISVGLGLPSRFEFLSSLFVVFPVDKILIDLFVEDGPDFVLSVVVNVAVGMRWRVRFYPRMLTSTDN